MFNEYIVDIHKNKYLITSKLQHSYLFRSFFYQAYVLDFGTEVYSWIGRHTKGAPRKMAAEIGLEHYNKGI